MNTHSPTSVQINAAPRATGSTTASAPGRGDAPSFDDAMKHASAAPTTPAAKTPSPPPAQQAQPAQPQATAYPPAAPPVGGSRHVEGNAKAGPADALDDADATIADTTGSAAAALANAATSAAQDLGQATVADPQPASDSKATEGDASAAAPAAADPANGQAIAAAMLALIQQSAPPAPAANTAATTPGATSKDAKGAIADDIGAAITASSKMAQALTGSLGGAVAGTVADTATGVVGKAVGLVGDAVAGLFGNGDKADPAKASQLPDPAQLAAGQAPQAAAPVSSPVALQSTQAAGTPAFANELGQQIAWMSNGDIKEASIRLHPEDMGQLDVKISVHQNRVDVVFAAQHPAAVQAVNQTLTQLDTMLAHHGLQLGQAQVGQQQAGPGGQGKSFAQAAQGGGGEPSDAPELQRATVRAPNSLVDDFA